MELRKETLQQKKGRGKVTSERRLVVKKELALLTLLVMKDKSDISQSLKNLDEAKVTWFFHGWNFFHFYRSWIVMFASLPPTPTLRSTQQNLLTFATHLFK